MSSNVLKDVEAKMAKSLQVYGDELKGIRTGRASPALVDHVKVDYYGTPTPLKQLAAITVQGAQLLMLQPYDQAVLPEIEKALQKADIGIPPQNDGKVIRLSFPPLSEDRRKQMVGVLKDLVEQTKVAMRNVRRDANKQIETEQKGNLITEDAARKLKDDVQKLLKKHEDKVAELFGKKQQEIMTV
jgi:ribosome recycling factor